MKWKHRQRVPLFIALALLIAGVAPNAFAEFQIQHLVLPSGAIDQSGGPYRLRATLGESPFEVSQGMPWRLSLGFWIPNKPETTGEGDIPPILHAFRLDQNNPNPFNPLTRITFFIPGKSGTSAPSNLDLYNVHGRHIRALVSQNLPAGPHVATWDGLDGNGCPVASGVYVVRLRVGSETTSKQCVLLR